MKNDQEILVFIILIGVQVKKNKVTEYYLLSLYLFKGLLSV